MPKIIHSKSTYWILFAVFCVYAFFAVFSQKVYTDAYIEKASVLSDIALKSIMKVNKKPKAIKVKGLYLTAYTAGSEQKIDQIIDLIKKTELNSVVIDIKDYSGYVLYDSKLPLVDSLKLESIRIKDLKKLIEKLKKNKIYTIARVSVFQDPLLARKKIEWAIKTKNGGLWYDKNGLAWVDPTQPKVWEYNIMIAKEAVKAGFDEINFDYIRFPTDGNLSAIVYTNGDKKRYEVIGDFFKYAAEEMRNQPAYISADLFGLTTEKGGEDDMYIGQRLEDAVKYFDYVCPMVYPSHYPTNYLGFKNPAEHPYEVVYNAMSKGAQKAQGQKAKLRTWIQVFNIGAIYDGDKIRAQIKASDDAGADGWIFWNAWNTYGLDGLERVGERGV